MAKLPEIRVAEPTSSADEQQTHGVGHRLFVRSVEFVSALMLALLSFAVLLFILGLSFPDGATLHHLMREQGQAGPSSYATEFDVSLLSEEEGTSPVVASLTGVQRTVRDRPAGAIAWDESRRGMDLGRRHAIQTLSNSNATISFDAGNSLELGQNSLLILRDVNRRTRSKRIEAAVVVVSGEFRGTFKQSASQPMTLQMSTDNSRFEVSTAAEEAADFRVSVDAAGAASLSVYEGQGKVTTGGKTILIPENHALNVDEHGRAGKLIQLPSPPRPTRPADGSQFVYGAIPPRVEFGWEGDDTEEFRLIVARDADFKDVVLDQRLDSRQLTHANLDDGRYYWQVSALRDFGEGRPSGGQSLQVSHDGTPPALEVDFGDIGSLLDIVTLRGKTEPGSRVFIHNVEIAMTDFGQFNHDLKLEPGVNVVVVESVDSAGNVTYQSRVLSASY